MIGIDHDEMVSLLQWRGVVPDHAAAVRTLDAVMDLLDEMLSPSEAAIVAEGLPPPLAGKLHGLALDYHPKVVELFEHVAGRTGARFVDAVERATVACQIIVEVLGEERARFLRDRLPRDWRSLFTAVERSPGVVQPDPLSGGGSTLATGRPGSAHPLSEAGPVIREPEDWEAPRGPGSR